MRKSHLHFIRNENCFSWKGITLLTLLLAGHGCKELGSESPRQPPRAAAGGRSTAVPVNSTTNEVGSVGQVRVRVADKAGAGIQGITPSITLVTLPTGTTVVSGASGSCGVTNFNGETTCSVTAGVPGTWYPRVLSPTSFHGGAMGFIQIGRSLRFATQPSCSGSGCQARADFTVQPAVEILDAAGNRVTAGADASRTITLTVVGGGSSQVFAASGTYPSVTGATSTSLAASAGLATFVGLDLNTAGTFTLSASATSAISGASIGSSTSSSLTILPQAAVALEFTTQPTNTSANIAFATQPVVRMRDQNGNVATSPNCVVTLQPLANFSGVPAKSLVGTLSEVAASGVANFQGNNVRVATTAAATGLTIQAVGSGPVGCSALTAASSSSFSIDSSGVPAQLVLAQGPSTAALSEVWPTQPVIHLLDDQGNRVTEESSMVVNLAIAAGSPAGTLGGGSNVQFDRGEAKFGGLFINSTTAGHAGTYNYEVTTLYNGVALPTLSFSQNITDAGLVSPFSLVFSQLPTSTSIGASVGLIQLKRVDANGALNFTDNTSTVTLNTGSGGSPATPTATMLGGIATFSGITYSTAGTKTMTASAAGMSSATTNLSIAAYGPKQKLLYSTQPSSGGALGSAAWGTQPVVRVVDAFDNTVSNATGDQISLACTQWTGGENCNLSGGSTTVSAINGVATFSGLRTSQLNLTNLVLRATATGLLATESDSFNGNRAQPVALRFLASPANVREDAGGTGVHYFSSNVSQYSPVTAELIDASGNRVALHGAISATVSTIGTCGVVTGGPFAAINGIISMDNLQTTFGGGAGTTVSGCQITVTVAGLASPSVTSNTFSQ
jgi:hypothetical protein